MAAAPAETTEQATPAKRRPRQAKKWLVFEVDGNDLKGVGVRTAKTARDACWQVAEGPLLERAQSKEPPKLVALPEDVTSSVKPYALKQTVVRAEG